MNTSPATVIAMMILTLLLGGCASLQPNGSSSPAAGAMTLKPLPDDVQTMVWRDPAAAAAEGYFIAPIRWQLDSHALTNAERAELESQLTLAIEKALRPATISMDENDSAHRIEATITGVDPSSPALNVVLSALVGPLDTGGASVEIVVYAGRSSQPVAALSSAQNGRVLSTKGFKRWGHAKQALEHAAMALAKLLSSPA